MVPEPIYRHGHFSSPSGTQTLRVPHLEMMTEMLRRRVFCYVVGMLVPSSAC
jgi:hypothetical protein